MAEAGRGGGGRRGAESASVEWSQVRAEGGGLEAACARRKVGRSTGSPTPAGYKVGRSLRLRASHARSMAI